MRILFLTNNTNTLDVVEALKKSDEVLVFKEKLTLEIVKDINPEYIISYNYRFIISEDIIQFIKGNIINLHVSFLPWNKGSYPNIWSFIDDTPKGVTIHYISPQLDEGNIILQKEIVFGEDETLESSYLKLQEEVQILLLNNWDKIKKNQIEGIEQVEKGTKHTVAETKYYLDQIDNWDITIKEFKRLCKKGNIENGKK